MKYYFLAGIALFLILAFAASGTSSTNLLNPMGSARTPLVSAPPPTPIPITTILAVGDIMLGRSVNLQSRKYQDYRWPFLQVAEVTGAADIFFANLENPIVGDCPPIDHGFKFCSPLESVTGLQHAGLDVVTLANNHATNYGLGGLESTKDSLSTAGISHTGLGEPAVLDSEGTTFAFLGYNDVGKLPYISPADPLSLVSDIESAKLLSDVVIVSFHWGSEYTASPSARQVQLAHLAVDAGADAVIGHHPHWVQSDEVYRDKPIFYSLGNFVFDQMWSEETKWGLAVRLTFQGSTLTKIDRLPVYIENYGQPKFSAIVNGKEVL